MLNNLSQIHLKLLQKEQYKKKRNHQVIWLVIEMLINLQKSQEVQHRIVQKQLKVKHKIQDLIQRYQKNYVYVSRKEIAII